MSRRVELLRAQGRELSWWAPQLPPSPAEAMAEVRARLSTWPLDQMALVGSSLGGFYATVLAEEFGCRAVVINPAVNPARDLRGYIGDIKAWHSDEHFYFQSAYIDELQSMTPATLTRPDRYFAIIAKGDEVLDWREMHERYLGARIKLLEGGDHALSDFADRHLSEVLSFLELG